MRLGQLTEPQRDVIRQLAESRCSGASIIAAARHRSADSVTAEIERLLDQLRAGGWLHITVLRDDRALYTIEPYRRPPQPRPLGSRAGLTLSRFAVMRRCDDDLLIESPRSWCAVRVHDADVIALLGAVIGTRSQEDGVSPPLLDRLLSDLHWGMMLVASPGEEDTAFEWRQWSPYELWFHQRTRREGIPEGGFGRTRWAAGQFEPAPARRSSLGESMVDLPRPDLAALQHTDVTLTDVLEHRRSIRRHDDAHPITIDQIGEFLYRSAGVRKVYAREGVEHVTGPNPSGGALDPLEFYVVVRLAVGLAPGLYRYDRVAHRLEHIDGFTRPVQRLVVSAQNATVSPHEPESFQPQVVVLLAARFGRIGWSYETLPYSLILKQVGVAYQTMYCVATAMRLAPCALGAGDSGAFAEATGLDAHVEGTVGEFILGSRPASDAHGVVEQDPA
jgi:SagB-type dehydrogenase family enzyme